MGIAFKLMILAMVAVGDTAAMAFIAPQLARSGRGGQIPILVGCLVSGLALLAAVLFFVVD